METLLTTKEMGFIDWEWENDGVSFFILMGPDRVEGDSFWGKDADEAVEDLFKRYPMTEPIHKEDGPKIFGANREEWLETIKKDMANREPNEPPNRVVPKHPDNKVNLVLSLVQDKTKYLLRCHRLGKQSAIQYDMLNIQETMVELAAKLVLLIARLV